MTGILQVENLLVIMTMTAIFLRECHALAILFMLPKAEVVSAIPYILLMTFVMVYMMIIAGLVRLLELIVFPYLVLS